MRTTLLYFTLMLGLVIPSSFGCATTTQRHAAVVVDTGLYTAIAGIDDTERLLSSNGQITAEQHAKLNPKIIRLLKAGKAVNSAIAVWPVGKPAPAELQVTINELKSVADSVIADLPDGATKSKLQTAVMLAQSAANLLLIRAGE